MSMDGISGKQVSPMDLYKNKSESGMAGNLAQELLFPLYDL
jgi:hypothetical protein